MRQSVNEQVIRRIDVTERSGVLGPRNLTRFSAQWLSPAADVRELVDTYWAVSWSLAPGETVTQQIIDHPAITLSIERGDVPAPFMVTAVRPTAWSRVIRGEGSVFAVRLRPAGLAALSDLGPAALGAEAEVTAESDPRAHGLLRAISVAGSPDERARMADALIGDCVRERPLSRRQQLANAAVSALVASPRVRTGRAVAAELGASERTLQRVLRETIARGPNDVARRIRLQEVVRQLSVSGAEIATVSANLGYADQAHLTKEFRAVTGTTPGRYVRELRRAQNELSHDRPVVR